MSSEQVTAQVDRVIMRRVLEMSYLHAWGVDGTPDLREEWRGLMNKILNTCPDLGEMNYCGRAGFDWVADL